MTARHWGKTPPEGKGQIVDVSYGWIDGHLYRRTWDRADHSIVWEVLDDVEARQLPEGWTAVNGAPEVSDLAWAECDDPREDPLSEGDPVSGGVPYTEDYDQGTVAEVDGDSVTVAWEGSLTQTTQSSGLLRRGHEDAWQVTDTGEVPT